MICHCPEGNDSDIAASAAVKSAAMPHLPPRNSYKLKRAEVKRITL